MTHQTAAMLVIGNEILSGRTREANAHLVAQKLFERGCRLCEIAVVPDIAEQIVETLNRLRNTYDSVITSGGIGPTHDDITMQSVANAFDVELVEHRFIVKLMTEYYGKDGMNEGRRRMARVPKGARLIHCKKTIAPGAHIGNIYVLAGVPDIFASQLETVLEGFGNTPFIRHEIDVELAESLFSEQLAEIQQHYPDVEIGSYPHHFGKRPSGKICLSSQNEEMLQQAINKVSAMLERVAPQA